MLEISTSTPWLKNVILLRYNRSLFHYELVEFLKPIVEDIEIYTFEAFIELVKSDQWDYGKLYIVLLNDLNPMGRSIKPVGGVDSIDHIHRLPFIPKLILAAGIVTDQHGLQVVSQRDLYEETGKIYPDAKALLERIQRLHQSHFHGSKAMGTQSAGKINLTNIGKRKYDAIETKPLTDEFIRRGIIISVMKHLTLFNDQLSDLFPEAHLYEINTGLLVFELSNDGYIIIRNLFTEARSKTKIKAVDEIIGSEGFVPVACVELLVETLTDHYGFEQTHTDINFDIYSEMVDGVVKYNFNTSDFELVDIDRVKLIRVAEILSVSEQDE